MGDGPGTPRAAARGRYSGCRRRRAAIRRDVGGIRPRSIASRAALSAARSSIVAVFPGRLDPVGFGRPRGAVFRGRFEVVEVRPGGPVCGVALDVPARGGVGRGVEPGAVGGGEGGPGGGVGRAGGKGPAADGRAGLTRRAASKRMSTARLQTQD